MALKQRVVSAIRKACEGLSYLATALAHPEGLSPTFHKYADMQEARTSPVSVDHDFCIDPTPEPRAPCCQLRCSRSASCTRSL